MPSNSGLRERGDAVRSPAFRLLTTVVRQPWFALRFRVRQWGRLPLRRGAVLLVSNHQNEDESEIIVQRAYAQGPWHSPLYAVASRRAFEPGFFAARMPWLGALERRFDFTRVFSWLGMLPIENHLSSRPLASLAADVRRMHGDLALGAVFRTRAFEGIDDDARLSALDERRNATVGERPTRLSLVKEPFRSDLLAAVRRAVERDLARVRTMLAEGATVYVTPEGAYSTDGRLGAFKGILERLRGSAEIWLAAVAFDPFRSGRMPMLYRILRPQDPGDVRTSLAAARPVTASALVATWLTAWGDEPFAPADAAQGVAALRAALPPPVFLDPELRGDVRGAVDDVLANLTARGTLVRDGARLRRGGAATHSRFPDVADLVRYQTRFLLETLDAAERLGRGPAQPAAARRVIVTADDFGLAMPVNEAVERAHRDGILTTASLMVAEPGAADAVRRARALPALRVGLHLVLVAGRPMLPPAGIPDLVDERGMLPAQPARAGFRFFFRPGIRRQLEAEIRAQFAAFAATGLRLDHVNAQCHMHVHPTVLGLVLRVAREYGSPPVRIPWEPFGPSWAAAHDRFLLRFANAVLLAPWLALMKIRLRLAGFAYNDRVFGLSDVGGMTADRVRALLAHVPPGVTEMFFHAATGRWPGIAADLAAYRLEDEFAALTSPDVARAFASSGSVRASFAELAAHAR